MKKGRKIFVFVRGVFILLLIALVFRVGIGIVLEEDWIVNFGKAKTEPLTGEKFDYEEYESYLKSQQSDIEGYTLYDLYEEGLNTDEGADTDLDGLTDKEEIEIYGTNPKKFSTSGDFYGDGYKIEHGMDVNTAYEYKNDLEFEGNHCKEITLKATRAEDFNACIDSRTNSGMYIMEGKNVFSCYTVFAFTGELTIDLSKIAASPDPENVNIYIQNFYEDEAEAVKFETKGQQLTPEYEFKYTNMYIIYLVSEKASLAKRLTSYVSGTDIKFCDLATTSTGERAFGMTYGSFGHMKVMYVETNDEALNNALKDKLVTMALDILDEISIYEVPEEDIHIISEEEMEKKAMLATKLCPDCNPVIGPYTGVANDFYSYGLLFTYHIIDMDGDEFREEYEAEIKKAEEEEAAAREAAEAAARTRSPGYFSRSEVLPFSNFGTELSPGGVCAGFAYLTSYLHNNGRIDETSGTYEYDGVTYSYDITKDKENEALINDLLLSDYKDKYFPANHLSESGTVSEDLSAGEEEFIKMINYFWAKEVSIPTNKYLKGVDGADTDKDDLTMNYYDGVFLEEIIDQLYEGKFLNARMLLNTGGGHEVNLVGYQAQETNLLETESVPGYVIYVYDSNYPEKLGTLTCEVRTISGRDIMIYDYRSPDNAYHATSGESYRIRGKDLWVSHLVVTDDQGNILNETCYERENESINE